MSSDERADPLLKSVKLLESAACYGDEICYKACTAFDESMICHVDLPHLPTSGFCTSSVGNLCRVLLTMRTLAMKLGVLTGATVTRDLTPMLKGRLVALEILTPDLIQAMAQVTDSLRGLPVGRVDAGTLV